MCIVYKGILAITVDVGMIRHLTLLLSTWIVVSARSRNESLSSVYHDPVPISTMRGIQLTRECMRKSRAEQKTNEFALSHGVDTRLITDMRNSIFDHVDIECNNE